MCWFSLRMWSWQLFFFLKPARQSGRMLFCSAHNISLKFMIFSRHLPRQLICDIGLYDEKLSLGIFFFAIIIIYECLQLVGRWPFLSEALKRDRMTSSMWGGHDFSMRLVIWSGPGAADDLPLFIASFSSDKLIDISWCSGGLGRICGVLACCVRVGAPNISARFEANFSAISESSFVVWLPSLKYVDFLFVDSRLFNLFSACQCLEVDGLKDSSWVNLSLRLFSLSWLISIFIFLESMFSILRRFSEGCFASCRRTLRFSFILLSRLSGMFRMDFGLFERVMDWVAFCHAVWSVSVRAAAVWSISAFVTGEGVLVCVNSEFSRSENVFQLVCWRWICALWAYAPYCGDGWFLVLSFLTAWVILCFQIELEKRVRSSMLLLFLKVGVFSFATWMSVSNKKWLSLFPFLFDDLQYQFWWVAFKSPSMMKCLKEEFMWLYRSILKAAPGGE